MTAAQTLLKVRRCGVTLVPSGDRLRFHPASALSSELVEELREHKESILEILARQEVSRQDTNPRIGSAGEVLELVRARFGTVEDPVVLPAPRGVDPMAQRHGDKVMFFREDWRGAEPRGFTAHKSDRGGAA